MYMLRRLVPLVSNLGRVTHDAPSATVRQSKRFAGTVQAEGGADPSWSREGLAFGVGALMAFAAPWLTSCLGTSEGAGLLGADELEKKLLLKGTHDESLPKPGELVFQDFRPQSAGGQARGARAGAAPTGGKGEPLRVVTWNIERGYKLDAVIAELRDLDADIIAIQEIDIGCDRSNNADTGTEIAQALGLNYVFLCEFTELRSPKRSPEAQGGGVHGNGIMTKFDILSADCIAHEHHPITWETTDHFLCRREPRLGERVTLAAVIDTPLGAVCTYSVHLEVFCGAISRLRQFADVFAHSRSTAAAGVTRQLICGDLNTMGHGVARLSPFHCTDSLRWGTLGQYEAQFWHDTVFAVRGDECVAPHIAHSKSAPALVRTTSRGASGANMPSVVDSASGASPSAWRRCFNQRLWDAGVQDEALCAALVNPGFSEVFPIEDATLDHPSFRMLGVSLMEGKLDWLLHRGGFEAVDRGMGNHDYSASDHKWLAVDLRAVDDCSMPSDL